MLVVIVIMVMVMATAGIRPRLRVERSLDQLDMPAQPLDHFADHVIGSDADAIAQQLHWQMAVPQMPDDPDHVPVPVRMDLHQVLRLRTDPDHAGWHHQSVPIAQPYRLRQINQHLRPEDGYQNDSTPEAPVIIDQHAVDFTSRIPTSRGENGLDEHQNRKYR
nr:hypothetical protein [Rhodopila sp.]